VGGSGVKEYVGQEHPRLSLQIMERRSESCCVNISLEKRMENAQNGVNLFSLQNELTILLEKIPILSLLSQLKQPQRDE